MLQSFIVYTNAVIKNKDITKEALQRAQSELLYAVESFKDSLDANGFNFKLLQFEIKDAKDIEAKEIKLGNKSLDAFADLRAEIIKAEKVTKDFEAIDAKKTLFKAVNIFNESTDVNGIHFKTLQTLIVNAEKIELKLKSGEAFMKLQSAIHKAKQITKEIEAKKA